MEIRKLVPLMILACLLAACVPADRFTQGTLMQKKSGGAPMSGCRVVAALPTPDPTLAASIPAVTPQDHILGAVDAPVTIVEYSDYT